VGTMTTTLAMFAATAGYQPSVDVISDQVDLIEINHFYDEKGQLILDQLIFYEWCPEKRHYDVRDWCLLKSDAQLPRKNHRTRMFVTVFRDGQTLRKVHAKTIRESWTQYDPELAEQEFLPKEKRRMLTKVYPRLPRRTASAVAQLTQLSSETTRR